MRQIFVSKAYKHKNKFFRTREEIIESEFIQTKELSDEDKFRTVGAKKKGRPRHTLV